MSSTYEIVWAAAAEQDLKGILGYIAADSPANASAVFRKIKEKTSRLRHFPESGRIVPELQSQGISIYRELIVSPWRIIYRVADAKIYILSVIDARQNVEDIVLNRLIKT